MLWFGEGQKIQFLSCPLPLVCPVPETVLQINIGQLKLFCHVFHFLANQTYPISTTKVIKNKINKKNQKVNKYKNNIMTSILIFGRKKIQNY